MSTENFFDREPRSLDLVFRDLWALLPPAQQEMPLDDFSRLADHLIDRARAEGDLKPLAELFLQIPGFYHGVDWVRPEPERAAKLRYAPIPTAADLDAILAGRKPLSSFRLPAGVRMSAGDDATLLDWVRSAAMPSGPYPILVIFGAGASGKTRLVHALHAALRASFRPIAAPRNTSQLMTAAQECAIVALDNLDKIPQFVAEGLSAIARGTVRLDAGHGAEPIKNRPVVITSLGVRDTRATREFLRNCSVVTLSGGQK